MTLQWTARQASLAKQLNVTPNYAWLHYILAVPFRLLAAVVTAQRHRRAVSELEALDDHLLNDIGIRRGDIDNFVRYRLADHRLRMDPSAERTGPQ
jgi:uncharacterized protein YjiS (DUF1127 family)